MAAAQALKRVRLLGLGFMMGTAGCAPHAPDLAAEAQRLSARDQEWARLAAAGQDVEQTASYWSDDAVIVPQGQPVVEGKAAIRAFVAGAFHTPGLHISWKSSQPAFSPDGKFAYLRGTNTLTMPGPDGQPLTLTGRSLTLWRRDADGQWRCILDMWNDPPVSEAAPRPGSR